MNAALRRGLWLAALLPWQAMACPDALDSRQVPLGVPPGWQAEDTGTGRHAWAGVVLHAGPPQAGASLAPTRTRRQGAMLVQTWTLDARDAPHWLVCRYAGTVLTLAQPLPGTPRRCTLTLDARGQPPVPVEWRCD